MNPETRDTLVHASRPVRIAASVALGMLALFLLVKTFDVMARFGQGENPQVNTITVTGEGESSATPDIARISFTVQETADTVSAAQDAAAKRGNDAIAAMKKLGVADKDVKTSDYSVSPQYASSAVAPCYPGQLCAQPTTLSNKIIGYQVSETVNVTARDTSKAGDLVTALGTLGVQNISGPNFAVDDDSGVMNDARSKAIANARDKAKELAKELGVSLGEVVSYSEDGLVMPYAMNSRATGVTDAAAPTTPNLPAGTDERSASVQVTYRIK